MDYATAIGMCEGVVRALKRYLEVTRAYCDPPYICYPIETIDPYAKMLEDWINKAEWVDVTRSENEWVEGVIIRTRDFLIDTENAYVRADSDAGWAYVTLPKKICDMLNCTLYCMRY